MPVTPLIQLAPGDFPAVRELFSALDFHLAVSAILAGTASGSVFVDDLLRPVAGLAWTGHRVYLAGQDPPEPCALGRRRRRGGSVIPRLGRAGGLVRYGWTRPRFMT